MSNSKDTQQSENTHSKNEMKKYKKLSRSFPETDGDEIVISGMAGKFPNSHNIEEYEYNLYNKVLT